MVGDRCGRCLPNYVLGHKSSKTGSTYCFPNEFLNTNKISKCAQYDISETEYISTDYTTSKNAFKNKFDLGPYRCILCEAGYILVPNAANTANTC